MYQILQTCFMFVFAILFTSNTDNHAMKGVLILLDVTPHDIDLTEIEMQHSDSP